MEHAHELRNALRDNFIGLYPIGSLAVGDFDLTSDVDFVVITERWLTDSDVRHIQSAHAKSTARTSRWVKHLEYSFFALSELSKKSSPYGPGGRRIEQTDRQLWYFGNGSSTIERSDHDNTLVTRWTLRYASRPVLGPEPPSFAPDVTADELRKEIRNSMVGWEQLVRGDPLTFRNRFHQVFLVLNNCRALQDLHEGRITSKLDGVRWAKLHIDHRWHELIDYCWRERQDTAIHVSQPADPDAFRQTLDFMSSSARLAEQFRLPTE
ncbi:MAG: hypothetical protein JWM12_717 [Ilumatobacteraceae bacterium]|nr:hypothetical protein [Ilumatobacteraceae bacterium]